LRDRVGEVTRLGGAIGKGTVSSVVEQDRGSVTAGHDQIHPAVAVHVAGGGAAARLLGRFRDGLRRHRLGTLQVGHPGLHGDVGEAHGRRGLAGTEQGPERSGTDGEYERMHGSRLRVPAVPAAAATVAGRRTRARQ